MPAPTVFHSVSPLTYYVDAPPDVRKLCDASKKAHGTSVTHAERETVAKGLRQTCTYPLGCQCTLMSCAMWQTLQRGKPRR